MSFSRGRGRGGRGGGICRNFALNKCQIADCRLTHSLTRQSEISGAHGNFCVNDICLVSDLVYTAGADDAIRGWRPTKTDERFELQPELVVECPAKVTSLCFSPDQGGLLVCGLAGGLIRVFNKTSGAVKDLAGHSGDVFGLIVHMGVIISAGWDATVRFWSGEDFGTCVVTPVAGNIKCIQLLGTTLWVGGVHGLTAISLAPLQVASEIRLQSPVMGLKAVGPSHLLCACLDGCLKVIDASTGLETFSKNLAQIEPSCQHPNIISLEVVVSEGGKMHAILGQRAGWAKFIELPEMKFSASFAVLGPGADLRTIVNAGGGLFLVGGSTGSLGLWKL